MSGNEEQPKGFEIKTNKYCLRFNEDKSQVHITVFETGRLITIEETRSFIKSKGIHDFDGEVIDLIFKGKRFNEEFKLCEGKPVKNGENSRLEILVDMEPRMNPDIEEDGSVNFKNIRSFPMVRANDIVAEILPPTKGIEGVDVFGEVIKATDGEVIDPPLGENVKLHPEQKNMIVAEKSGHIMLTYEGTLEIRDMLIVDGDIDYSVGNIDFDGTVMINGDVKSGFSVRATGNVEIDGTVEDAVVESEKTIIVKAGFIGKNKGKIYARQDVTIHHIDNQSVEAGRDLIIGEEAISSELKAGQNITVLGKKGAIIGGFAYAANKINSRFAGSETGVTTQLSAGVSKEILERIRELDGLIDKNEENLQKIKKNTYELFRLKLDRNQLPPDKERLLEYLKKAQVTLPQQIESLKEELQEKVVLKDKYKYSYVEVSDTVYAKTRILMGEDILELRDAYHQAVFRYEKGSISLFIKGKRIKL